MTNVMPALYRGLIVAGIVAAIGSLLATAVMFGGWELPGVGV